ncbi:c-type cytochrome, methanol metabolism-related [Paracoccus pacificus]|uniref:C-type cytochrome, methanol metabolism-related n=1 Tax=Paracoccus pacificus TaxID=1463598 RepID=A0ABW4R639_9RHOB
MPPPTEADKPPTGVAAGGTILPNGMDITASYMENGRWYNADGIPTFKIEDGVVDYAVFSGYRRYSAECHVCHGPDGEGSTYAPALKNSVMNMDYYQFQEIVASGKQNTGTGTANQVMPAFGTNKNVWCYIDDIYVYLLVRGTDSLARGRPAKKADKSPEFAAQEDSCMNG